MPRNYSKLNKAVISGWNLSKMSFWKNTCSKTIKTSYGKVNYYQLKDCIFIPRHSIKENIPPHKINYRANISALKKLGVKYIFAFSSVGSLKKEIKPGDFLIASDYIDFNPPTFYEKEAQFIIPELSLKLRKILIKTLRRLKIKFKTKGVYFHTKGPRLETKAEILAMRQFADIVGMTMAKEATLAEELGLEYISLCSVDNYANGIVRKPLSVEEIKKGQLRVADKTERVIREILKKKIN